jgi:hypothetical protein
MSAQIEVDGVMRTIEPRPPRAGEWFRVRPGEDRRKDAWVLDNDLTVDPEKNPELWSDLGYWLLAEKLLTDDDYAKARSAHAAGDDLRMRQRRRQLLPLGSRQE